MNQRLSSPVVSVLHVFFALLTLTAVGVELRETFRDGESVGNFFSYFTIQSNLFAAAMLLVTTWFVVTKKDTERLPMLRVAAFVLVNVFVWIANRRNRASPD